jgi:hypothetical protein
MSNGYPKNQVHIYKGKESIIYKDKTQLCKPTNKLPKKFILFISLPVYDFKLKAKKQISQQPATQGKKL